MSQASRPLSSSQSNTFPIGDVIALVAALVLLASFRVLPWVVQNNESLVASNLMSGLYEATPISSPTSVLLIAIAAVVGLVGGAIGVINAKTRPITRFIAAMGGIVGIVYYISVYVGLQNPQTLESSPAIGYWIALIASIVLIVQVVFPRQELETITPTEKLRRFQVLLVVAGMIVTGYMSYNKLAGIPLQCSDTGIINCAVVENSAWSRVAGIPTALLGFIAHTMLGTVLILEKRVPLFRDHAPLMLFGIALFSVFYHSYLTYVSIFILKALCPFCLTAMAIMVIELVISSVRFKRYMAAQ